LVQQREFVFSSGRLSLFKRNYQFEKRQKDMAKKQKQEEKRQKKREKAAPTDNTPPEAAKEEPTP
jgi:hypothetical protein